MTVPIEKTLIGKIKDTLENIPSIRKVVPYPITQEKISSEVDTFPAVVFFPTTSENQFSDSASNFETRNFGLTLLVQAKGKGITKETLFTDAIPQFYDDIIREFNKNWDGGVIDGHRVWFLLDSGNRGLEVTDQGLIAWADLNLRVRLSTDAR